MKYLRKNDLIMLALSLVLFAVLQGLISGRVLSSFWQLNLLIIGINIILSASLNLINGYTGQFSLGHAGFMAVGAYVGVVLTTNFHVPFGLALIAGGIAAGCLGFLVGIPTLRLRGDYLAIATLGLGEIIRIVIMNIQYVGGAAGFKGIPHNTTFAWVFFIMLFTLFFIKNFVNSNHGRACLAIRENEIAAESMIEYVKALKEKNKAVKEDAAVHKTETMIDTAAALKKKEYESHLIAQENDSEDTFFITAEQLEEAMQKVMDQYAGGIATDYQYNEERLVIGKKRIGELLGMVDELKAKDMFELKDIYEVRERLIVCQTLIEHLRARKETRWHSFGENTDYPEESSKWLKYVNSKRKPDGETEIIFRELVTGGKVYECTDFTE